MTRAVREQLAVRGVGGRSGFCWRGGDSRNLLAASIGVLSCLIAVAEPPDLVGLAGYAYFLLGPAMAIPGVFAGRRRRRFEAAPA